MIAVAELNLNELPSHSEAESAWIALLVVDDALTLKMMSDTQPVISGPQLISVPCNRVSVIEISRRLAVGKMAVYEMLEQKVLPGIRLGRRWIVTRQAYEQWEKSCGVARMDKAA